MGKRGNDVRRELLVLLAPAPAGRLAVCGCHPHVPPPAACPWLAQNGVRNSLLVAPMPTASTSQILGNNECFEPYTSNIYVRRVLSGGLAPPARHGRVNSPTPRLFPLHLSWLPSLASLILTCPCAAGEFVVVNQHLLHDLTRLGLWDTDVKNEIVAASGSVAVRWPLALR